MTGSLLTNQHDDIKTVSFHHQKTGDVGAYHSSHKHLNDDLFLDVCFVCSCLIDLPSHFHCLFAVSAAS